MRKESDVGRVVSLSFTHIVVPFHPSPPEPNGVSDGADRGTTEDPAERREVGRSLPHASRPISLIPFRPEERRNG